MKIKTLVCTSCKKEFKAGKLFFDDNGEPIVRRPICPQCACGAWNVRVRRIQATA